MWARLPDAAAEMLLRLGTQAAALRRQEETARRTTGGHAHGQTGAAAMRRGRRGEEQSRAEMRGNV